MSEDETYLYRLHKKYINQYFDNFSQFAVQANAEFSKNVIVEQKLTTFQVVGNFSQKYEVNLQP